MLIKFGWLKYANQEPSILTSSLRKIHRIIGHALHELGHCDLKQDHLHNTIMKLNFPDGFFCKETRDWDPLYEDFFSMQNTRLKDIFFEEDNNPEGYRNGSHPDDPDDPNYQKVVYREKNLRLMALNELFLTLNKCLSIGSTPCTNMHEEFERLKKEAMEYEHEITLINPSDCS